MSVTNPNGEYTGTNVSTFAQSGGGPACTYTPLQDYNALTSGIALPTSVRATLGTQIVPNYSSPGYDTLNHGLSASQFPCNSYFTIDSAYMGCAKPQVYSVRKCT